MSDRIADLLSADADAPPLPQALADWFAQLTLLYGVPFEYLVADPRMLPPESIRFFYLDQNWVDRAVDGALSVATLSTAETIFNEALFKAIYAQLAQSQQSLRAALRKKALPAQTVVGGTYAGLLMRSVVVSGWPGLEVQATKATKAVDIVRMDRLAPDLLLVLFAGVPDEVDMIEPSEGLHFGVVPEGDGTTIDVSLRGLGFPASAPYTAGAQIMVPPPAPPAAPTTPLTASTTMRPTSGGAPGGVVDIATLVTNVTAKMSAVPPSPPAGGALGPGGVLTSGGFAIQLVRGAGFQAFTVTAPAGPPPGCPPPVLAAKRSNR